jgi:hypothetical protein
VSAAATAVLAGGPGAAVPAPDWPIGQSKLGLRGGHDSKKTPNLQAIWDFRWIFVSLTTPRAFPDSNATVISRRFIPTFSVHPCQLLSKNGLSQSARSRKVSSS